MSLDSNNLTRRANTTYWACFHSTERTLTETRGQLATEVELPIAWVKEVNATSIADFVEKSQELEDSE